MSLLLFPLLTGSYLGDDVIVEADAVDGGWVDVHPVKPAELLVEVNQLRRAQLRRQDTRVEFLCGKKNRSSLFRNN